MEIPAITTITAGMGSITRVDDHTVTPQRRGAVIPMITNFIKKFQKPAISATVAEIPPGQRVYCIGDIHGRADLLQELHEQILTDAADYSGDKSIVYLGDYIDRGEQSKQVIDLLLTNPLTGFKTVYLQGNHEQVMLSFIEFPEASASWLSFGGREAVNSYGIPLAHIPGMNEVTELARQLDNKLPDTHRDFLQNCQACWRCGSYYFVHAGIEPGVALDQQELQDQLWIRDEFLRSNKDHGAIIVHGHSICDEPEVLPNRIGIDTGAFRTGILTCLVLEGAQHRFLQTGHA